MQMQCLEEIVGKIRQNIWDMARDIVVKVPPTVP